MSSDCLEERAATILAVTAGVESASSSTAAEILIVAEPVTAFRTIVAPGSAASLLIAIVATVTIIVEAASITRTEVIAAAEVSTIGACARLGIVMFLLADLGDCRGELIQAPLEFFYASDQVWQGLEE